jgi:hypothetical protein
VIAASGESLGKAERLAQGIHEAWTATAGGLVIAIPTLLAYHILMSRIDAAAAALDSAAKLWLDADANESVVEAMNAEPSMSGTGVERNAGASSSQAELVGSAT